MVKLNRIYTRTGDDGTTGLGDGARRPKYDARVTAYGEVDELNSTHRPRAALDHCGSGDADLQTIDEVLARVQNDLFDLGADLCVPPKPNEEPGASLRITPVAGRGAWSAPSTRSTPISRRSNPSCCLAAARPRRRCIWRAPSAGGPSARWSRSRRRKARPSARRCIHYVNRLSDYLFVASRFANKRGAETSCGSPARTVKRANPKRRAK